MHFRSFILDRYILSQILGTMFSVLAVVMSLMFLEHLPRLLELTSQSGHRGYIVAHTVTGLLPEYGGIGLPVGLFLGIALTIRKLALRGELDVIEACGIAPLRWMRIPLALTAIVSILTMLNQGWLAPAGEAKLADIGNRMKDGEFGNRLPAGQFIDLGSGGTLLFQKIDPVNGELLELFLRAEGKIFTARRGRSWTLPSGTMAIELYDGQVMQERDASVLQFAQLHYRAGETGQAPDSKPKAALLKQVDSGLLWANGTTSSRSAVYGRCLWAAIVLLVPVLALVLGKPARRQSGAVGILCGLLVLVLGLKMATPLIDGHSAEPEFAACGILASWGLFVSGLLWAERVFGRGFVDLWANRIFCTLRPAK